MRKETKQKETEMYFRVKKPKICKKTKGEHHLVEAVPYSLEKLCTLEEYNSPKGWWSKIIARKKCYHCTLCGKEIYK